MEIILNDDDDNEVYCEPGNGEDLSCLLEGKWLNDKVSYATFVVILVNYCLCVLTDHLSLVLKATPEKVCCIITTKLLLQESDNYKHSVIFFVFMM